MSEYLSGRQNPVPDRPLDESEADLAFLAQCVGEAWLGKEDRHPLQRLWGRADALATSQLLTIGEALRTLSPNFQSWIKHQLRALKADKGERRGAILEIIALFSLRSAGLNARPTPKNHPGYDITVDFGGASLDISVKNFGMSEHELAAKRGWELVLKRYRQARAGGLQTAAGVVIEANRYPSVDDWNALAEAMPSLVSAPWNGDLVTASIGECWQLIQHPLPTKFGPFAKNAASYQLIATLPFHQNEHANLISYLEKASANARKHARLNPTIGRALFVRIRESAAAEVYRDWAADYLRANPEGPLDAVLLYQPTMTMTAERSHALHHAFLPIFGPSYAIWHAGRLDRQLRFSVPIGLTGGPADRQIQMGDTRIPIGPKYWFQRGEFFISGTTEGNLRFLAPGIHQHAVLTFGDGGGITLQGKFPPEEALDLFD